MNKILYFSLVFSLIGFTAFSQKGGRIIGGVQDKNTLETLMGVNIVIEGTTFGTITDETGRFNLSLPVGTYTITASILGYKNEVLFHVEVTSGNDQIINFEMVSQMEALDGVLLTYNRNKSATTTDMITPLSVQQLT